MRILDKDIKILWARAAGMCSNPDCGEDLTVLLDDKSSFNFGEMAHIIAKSKDGPRANGKEGSNDYSNLILLCPTCHRKIDKAPEEKYPEELLRKWKEADEQSARNVNSKRFENLDELKKAVGKLLIDNHTLWKLLGPESEAASDPGSNLHLTWELRKLGKIIPNNRKIINMIRSNEALLDSDMYKAFAKFEIHADEFEQNQYDRIDDYPRFPECFGRLFSNG